jgi:hypothetical protein
MKFTIAILLLFLSFNKAFAQTCEVNLIKKRKGGYSKTFSFLASKNCTIDPLNHYSFESNKESVSSKQLKKILNQITKTKLYQESCPKCNIEIFTDIEALEWSYKIMNWVSLGIDENSYNQLRNNLKVQTSIQNHLALVFEDYGYYEGKMRIYPEF